MKLVIIEGIGKKETVEKYLGPGYKVFATKGHVRDLPTKTLAVNVKKDFEPKYVIMDDKKDVVADLKNAVDKADEVLLATDPDREGEAISWHVANILGIPPESPVRIEFNEISKRAVQNALKHPRAIDINLVDAQQARRVLDRLVGYKLSPVLCKKIQNKLSAGRVQSVTLRLVVEREREILDFKPEEYWPFFSVLKSVKGNVPVRAALSTRGKQKFKIPNEEVLREVISELDGKTYEVTNVKKSVTKSKPPAPFITSTMQQDAQNKLGMSSKQTSSTAQTLYEGVDLPGEGKVALVTYIRTDSTRVSDDAIREARTFIANKFGENFIPAKPNIYKSKKSAQDAHEAIRPISLDRTPESIKNAVNKYQYKLYKLIYERFMASQMSEATYNSLAVEISAGNFGFKVNGKSPLFPGYTAVYSMYTENKDEEENSDKLPDFEVGEKLSFVEYKYEQKFTKPPARFTEASLVKTMDEDGIGRPATYTPTVTLLQARNYIETEGKYLKPTQLGMDVTDMLVKYFPEIMDVQFTAEMEKRLDEIEDGGVIWQRVVGDFYDGFEEKISNALGDSFSLKAPDQKTDVACPTCGSLMVIKSGRFGKFLACPNYPKCKTTMPFDEETGKPLVKPEPAPVQESDVKCSKCGRTMVIKQGKYGPFLACPGYPKCKNIMNIDNPPSKEPEIESAPCPECGKPLKKITARGSVFYGCTGYPDCRFTSNSPLAKGKCPECGSYLLIRNYKDGVYHVCSSKTCKHKQKVEG